MVKFPSQIAFPLLELHIQIDVVGLPGLPIHDVDCFWRVDDPEV